MEARNKKSFATRIKLFSLIVAALTSVLAASNSAVQLWRNIDELIHLNSIKQVEQSAPQKSGIASSQKKDEFSNLGKK